MEMCMGKALDVLDTDCVVEGVVDDLPDEGSCGVGVHRVRQHCFAVGGVAGKCISFGVYCLRIGCHEAQAKANGSQRLHNSRFKR